MLERIQIKDFQKHDRLRIKFDERITAITGPSDAGKSSMLRALRWVATNRPRGDGFVRDGAKGTSVVLRMDGSDVERIRRGAENEYRIDGKVFKAFGADVPEAVSRLLNLGPENFGGQHDPPFWFCLTAGEVAKELNAIVDLSVIDEVTARIATRLRKAKAEAEVADGRHAEAERERGRLEFVPKMDGELKVLEKLAAERDRTRDGEARLRALVDNGIKQAGTIRRLSGAVQGGLGVVEAGSDAVEARKRVDHLLELIRKAREAKRLADREVPGLCGLDALRDAAGRKRKRAKGIGDLTADARRSTYLVGKAEGELVAARATLERETEGLCPLCGGPMKV